MHACVHRKYAIEFLVAKVVTLVFSWKNNESSSIEMKEKIKCEELNRKCIKVRDYNL